MLRWNEKMKRYHYLKKTTALNALTRENIQKLWLPKVIWENAKKTAYQTVRKNKVKKPEGPRTRNWGSECP